MLSRSPAWGTRDRASLETLTEVTWFLLEQK